MYTTPTEDPRENDIEGGMPPEGAPEATIPPADDHPTRALPPDFAAQPTIPLPGRNPLAAPGVDTAAPWALAPLTPPLPPAAGLGSRPAGQPRRRDRRPVLAGLALLLVLALGIGAGGAIEQSRLSAAATAGQHTATVSSSSSTAAAGSSAAGSLELSIEQVAQAVQPSVVEVTSTSGRQGAIGSGEILTADGYLVTNDHVVRGYDTYTVTLASGQVLPARVVGEAPQDDLAVLKVAATGLQPITFGDSSKALVGEFVLAVGSPLGLQQSTTFGIVSALNRSASEAPDGPGSNLAGLIQTSAPLNPGNSGGALVDLSGRLIGIPTLGATDTQTGSAAAGIGFAIPSARVQAVVAQLMR